MYLSCEAAETQRESCEWPTGVWAKLFNSETDGPAASFSFTFLLVSFILFPPSSLCEFMIQKLFTLTSGFVVSSLFFLGFRLVIGSRSSSRGSCKSSCAKPVSLVNSSIMAAEENSERFHWVSPAKINMRRNPVL